MSKVIALVGNPNCGKSTLFNTLTGTYQKTGNWTGVTVEKKEGYLKNSVDVKIVDLPGAYSLNSQAEDERAVYTFLKESTPDVVINVLDGTNLERNLYLTFELAELKIPTVIAVNMYDRLHKNGIKLNVARLSKITGVPVVPISAVKKTNVDALIKVATNNATPLISPNLGAYNGQTLTEKRYAFIETEIKGIIEKKQTAQEKFTLVADNVLTHKIWGIPIFLGVMTLVYFLSIKIGSVFGGYISSAFDVCGKNLRYLLIGYSVPEWLVGLVCDAIISGLGTLSSFFPQILVLFALMAIIEQSGYSARIAFILDRFFCSFGLSGKSIIPMTVACGCTVTGLMATRTIENKGERRMTVFLAPFMPCGARTAVFGWFASVFFDGNAFIAASMYFIAIIAVAVFGRLLKRFKYFQSSGDGFLLEMPLLSFPSVKDVLSVLLEKIKEFVSKAGAIVFLVSVTLWCLQNVGIKGYTYGQVENSFLYWIGNVLKYLFYPLGFGNWQASVAAVSGILAKEAAVETLHLVAVDPTALFYNGFSVYAFMVFVQLSPPCLASIVTARKELGSKKATAMMLTFQFLSGYISALIINLTGLIIESVNGLLLSFFIVIIIMLLCVTFIKRLRKNPCKLCGRCAKGEKVCPINKNHSTIV